jgi:REP element-mobilizing transposase RayT
MGQLRRKTTYALIKNMSGSENSRVNTAPPMKHGGKRRGAGRKKTGRRKQDAPHRVRPPLSSRHPVHVVMRVQVRVSWRDRDYYKYVRRAMRGMLGRTDFQIVHVSIQDTHLHLLVEADNRKALTRGMQSFNIRLARIVHAEQGGVGKVFKYRYHATQIRTASHARHALAYVLNNWRRHYLDVENGRFLKIKLDPYSSAITFTGWQQGRFRIPADYEPLPVAAARTALLAEDWKMYGMIDIWERPGPI